MHPDFVGHRSPQILMVKRGGADKVLLWARELGVENSNDEIDTVVHKVKLRALDQRCSLCEEEYPKIVGELRK